MRAVLRIAVLLGALSCAEETDSTEPELVGALSLESKLEKPPVAPENPFLERLRRPSREHELARIAGLPFPPRLTRADGDYAQYRYCIEVFMAFESNLVKRWPFRWEKRRSQAADLDVVYRPLSGEIWAYYFEYLHDRVMILNDDEHFEFVDERAAQLFRRELLTFYDHSLLITRALYQDGGSSPSMTMDFVFNATPEITAATILIDGTGYESSGAGESYLRVSWHPPNTEQTAEVHFSTARDVAFGFRYTYRWALLRMLDGADARRSSLDPQRRVTTHWIEERLGLDAFIDVILPPPPNLISSGPNADQERLFVSLFRDQAALPPRLVAESNRECAEAELELETGPREPACCL